MIITIGYSNSSVFSESPSFTRQQVLDDFYDWFLNDEQASLRGYKNISTNLQDCKIYDITTDLYRFPSQDIAAITYMSDGNYVNATIWLTGSNNEDINIVNGSGTTEHGENNLTITHLEKTYGITVDADSVFDYGSDYTIAIVYAAQVPQEWARFISERSAWTESVRTVESQLNYTNHLTTENVNGGVIPFSFNLEAANYPTSYTIYAYVTDLYLINGRVCYLHDSSAGIPVPPPKYEISMDNNSIFLRPGEEKTVKINIKTNTDIGSAIYLFSDISRSSGLVVGFIPNITTASDTGASISYMNIKALSNATVDKPYFVPVNANVSFYPNVFNLYSNELINLARLQNISEYSNLTVTILPPFTAADYLSQIYTSWILPLQGIWSFFAGIAIVLGPLIFKRYRKMRSS